MQKLLESILSEVEGELNRVNWKDQHVYADFLAQTFYFVSHSTRLLALAASRFPVSQDQFFKRFVQHLGEEKNHEKIALTDLKNLGFEMGQYPELGETRAFYEAQYYKIEHLGPTALMGYILFLEAIAVEVGPKIYKKVVAAHGEKPCRFLKIHIEEDASHVQQAVEVVGQVSKAEQQVIEKNLIQSGAIYKTMILRLGQRQTISRGAA